MARKRHTAEEIVTKLRQVDVLTAQGKPVSEAIRTIGVTDVASRRVARWRDLLHLERSKDRDRDVEAALQHVQAAFFTGLSTTRSLDH